jgi:hypothetical protein
MLAMLANPGEDWLALTGYGRRMARQPAHPRLPPAGLAVLAALVSLGTASGCATDGATPIEPGSATSAPATPHLLEPTEQMRDLARQQCLDDPSLTEGVINAVDPADPDQTLVSVVVDCAEVR